MSKESLLIYRLKRLWGTSIVLHYVLTSVTDRESGQVSNTEVPYVIKKAVVIPEDARYMSEHLVTFKLGDREIIVDKVDLSTEPTINSYIVHDGKKYQIVAYQNLAIGYYFQVRCFQGKVAT